MLLLTSGLHKQGQAYHLGLEKELRKSKFSSKSSNPRGRRLKRRRATRKVAEASAAKLWKDFHTYRNKKADEKRRFAADAQKVANIYHELIQSVGEDTEVPREAAVPEFMSWLSNELAALSRHMAIGREYASMISLRAFAQFLADNKCDHFDKGEIKDTNSYWKVSDEAHGATKRFFDSFWRPGGHDLTLLRAALACAKVFLALLLVSLLTFHDSGAK